MGQRFKNVVDREEKEMFYVAVCDDDRYFRQNIKEIVSDYLNKEEIIYQMDMLESGEELLSSGIGPTRYTVIFLDIDMVGKNGMAVAQKIRKVDRDVFIVFVTASYDYVLEGYKVGAVRYLVKGSDRRCFRNNLVECMDSIMEKINYTVVKKAFAFKEGRREIQLEKLLYVESSMRRLVFHVMEDTLKTYTLSEKMSEVEKMLAGNDFIRIHQSYLVNFKYIKKISRCRAVLYNNMELAIARTRYMQVKEAFITYLGGDCSVI